MKKLCYLIRMTFQTKFAYIKAFWFNIFGTAVSILIYYFLWKYVFQSRDELHGFTAVEITTYVIISRLLSSQFSGGINREFSEWVQKGDIVVELLRPVPLVFTLFGKRVGEFLFFLLFKGIPVSILATFILGGTGPDGAVNFVLFLVSVFISIGLMFWIEVMVGLISFFTLNSYGIGYTKTALMSILSGGIVPLFLFRKVWQRCWIICLLQGWFLCRFTFILENTQPQRLFPLLAFRLPGSRCLEWE